MCQTPFIGQSKAARSVRFYSFLMYSICDTSIMPTSNFDFLYWQIANFQKCQLNTHIYQQFKTWLILCVANGNCIVKGDHHGNKWIIYFLVLSLGINS